MTGPSRRSGTASPASPSGPRRASSRCWHQRSSLRLLTPPSFLRAVSEGGDLTAHDTAVAEAQITHHAIRVWVVNTQNLTPEIQRLSALARAAGIPIATITETLSPATASFQSWQTAQLDRLRAALARGTGR